MPTDPLIAALQERDQEQPQEARWVDAVVSSLTPLEVTIYGVTGIPADRLAHYAPASTDQVWGQLLAGGRYIIHGRQVAGG